MTFDPGFVHTTPHHNTCGGFAMRKRILTMKRRTPVLALACVIYLAACSSRPGKLSGPLISSRTTMVTAWDFPKNPLTDKTLDDPKLYDAKLANQIRTGFRIFTNTPQEAAQFAPSKMSCNNCHLNGGQRERSLPLVGV